MASTFRTGIKYNCAVNDYRFQTGFSVLLLVQCELCGRAHSIVIFGNQADFGYD